MTRRPVIAGDPEQLVFEGDAELLAMYLLSPYVWMEGDEWWVAVRAVPRSDRARDKIARVHVGRSDDGVRFRLDAHPALSPGPDADDSDGCEDPTVVRDGTGLRVFYSGWNEDAKVGRLLSATTDGDPRRWSKQGRVLSEPSRFLNPKEAVVVRADDEWRLLLEYATAGRSAIGLATSPSLGGPWTPLSDPLLRRHGRWDDFHLSPGAVLLAGEEPPLLFYNGANDQTKWRVGWAQLDSSCTSITDRGDAPLIVPEPVSGEDTDIAFCSSAVQHGDDVWLYYTISDKDTFRTRVTISD